MTPATQAIRFLESLSIPEGPKAGQSISLAPVQRQFVKGALADGKSALGSAPTLVLMDERGHWQSDQGDALEHALLSGLGKRGER